MKIMQAIAVVATLCIATVAHAQSTKNAPSNGPHAAAEALMYKASDAIARNDMPAAMHSLRECVSVDKFYPKCPRILAILYGKQGDQKKAATYYRVYLKEDPKAKDAAAVRDLVREYEAD